MATKGKGVGSASAAGHDAAAADHRQVGWWRQGREAHRSGAVAVAMRKPAPVPEVQVRLSAILAELHGGDERAFRENAERVAAGLRASMISRDWAVARRSAPSMPKGSC